MPFIVRARLLSFLLLLQVGALASLVWMHIILLDDVGSFFRAEPFGLLGLTLALGCNLLGLLLSLDVYLRTVGHRAPHPVMVAEILVASSLPFAFSWLLVSDSIFAWGFIVASAILGALATGILFLQLPAARGRAMIVEPSRRPWLPLFKICWVMGTVALLMLSGGVMEDADQLGGAPHIMPIVQTSWSGVLLGISLMLVALVAVQHRSSRNNRWNWIALILGGGAFVASVVEAFVEPLGRAGWFLLAIVILQGIPLLLQYLFRDGRASSGEPPAVSSD